MQRLVVVNRSRLLESNVNGAWVVDSVKPDLGIAPGIYALHRAIKAPVDRRERFEGTFIHADNSSIFQALADGRIVAYDKFAFRERPVIGQKAVVDMNYGLADMVTAPAPARTKGLSLRQLLALAAILPALAFPDLSEARGLLDFIARSGVQHSTPVAEHAVYAPAQQHEGFAGCASLFPGNAPIALSSVAPQWKPTALCSNNFAVLHSGLTKTPLMVIERLTAAQIDDARGERRTNRFFADPRLPHDARAELTDYQGSGYERGHLSPAANQPDPLAMAQSFALSNMVPQDPVNNEEIWSKIESDVRKFARRARGDVFVFSGPIFEAQRPLTIGADQVWVPTHLFKLVHDAASGRSWAYILENSSTARIEPPISYEAFVRRTGWQPLGAPQGGEVRMARRGPGF